MNIKKTITNYISNSLLTGQGNRATRRLKSKTVINDFRKKQKVDKLNGEPTNAS